MLLKKPKKIPRNPGIYIFIESLKPLYVGKALNLKNRIAQYFQNSNRLPAKIQKMLTEATRLEIIKLNSEVEALIKEAELIKKYRPKYNALMRDDKNYFFVGITEEEYPRIFITHQPRAEGIGIRGKGLARQRKLSPIRYPLTPRYIGPFTGGGALKETLKLLRRIFPYCTCKGMHKRPCLASQIGKCPGYCCIKNQKSKIPGLASARPRAGKNQNYRKEYRKNIKNLAEILSGRKTRLAGQLKKRLRAAAAAEKYEEAARLRDQVFGLANIFRHRQTLREQLRKDDIPPVWRDTEWRLKKLLKTQQPLERIEGYDISNLAGKEATGSMVVFRNGVPDKGQYRKFRIKTVPGASDVGMMKEVLERRFGHPEWPRPQLMVVDGGKAQLNAALAVLRGKELLVTALAKREEVLFIEKGRTVYLKKQALSILHFFQRIRDESHRFARAYHHKLRQKAYAETSP